MGFHLLPLIQKMKLYSHLNSAISTNQIQNIKKKKKKKKKTELNIAITQIHFRREELKETKR